MSFYIERHIYVPCAAKPPFYPPVSDARLGRDKKAHEDFLCFMTQVDNGDDFVVSEG